MFSLKKNKIKSCLCCSVKLEDQVLQTHVHGYIYIYTDYKSQQSLPWQSCEQHEWEDFQFGVNYPLKLNSCPVWVRQSEFMAGWRWWLFFTSHSSICVLAWNTMAAEPRFDPLWVWQGGENLSPPLPSTWLGCSVSPHCKSSRQAGQL